MTHRKQQVRQTQIYITGDDCVKYNKKLNKNWVCPSNFFFLCFTQTYMPKKHAETSDALTFRGTSSLERSLQQHENHIRTIDDHIQKKCAGEIEALKHAQKCLDEKLNAIMQTEEVSNLESKLNETQNRVGKHMRRLQRELNEKQDEIIDDMTIDDKTRREKMLDLQKVVQSEYTRLVNEYPAAMKVQMLQALGVTQKLLPP